MTHCAPLELDAMIRVEGVRQGLKLAFIEKAAAHGLWRRLREAGIDV
jgi:hypothetical protein